jgi:hypothetical protein
LVEAYDPIVDVVPSRAGISGAELVRDLTLAYEVTRNRFYLKPLRIARRLN